MKIVSKVLFFLLINLILSTQTILHAKNYDNNILEIFAKIIPRIVLMSSIKNKIDTNINICILRDKLHKRSALTLINKMTKSYPEGIGKYKITFKEDDFTNLSMCKNSHLTFIFDTDEKNLKDTINTLNTYKGLTMSYNTNYLEYGVEASLFIGKNVVPYINVQAVLDNSIELDNMLLRISKIYRKKN